MREKEVGVGSSGEEEGRVVERGMEQTYDCSRVR